MLSAIAVTMPKRSVIRPVTTPPEPKPMKIMVVASETAPRRCPEFGLHGRHHHHDRPHADRADRGDQEDNAEPHPGLTGVGGESGGIGGLSGGSVHKANLAVHCPKVNPQCREIRHAGVGAVAKLGATRICVYA